MTGTIWTDEHATKHLEPGVEIWHRYRREIADSGETGDARLTLCMAPATAAGELEWIYLEGNGDPTVIGTLCADELDLDRAAETWIRREPWIGEALGIEREEARS